MFLLSEHLYRMAITTQAIKKEKWKLQLNIGYKKQRNFNKNYHFY